MPLLPLETFVFPDNLFTISPAEPGDLTQWWVLHTKPRAEKSLARKCLERSIPFFLPLYQRQWRSRGRSFRSHMPLFPGYLFLHGDHDIRTEALMTNLVARVIPATDQERLSADLTRVYQLVTSGAPLTPEDRMAPGNWVEIVSGPLAGLEGKIIRAGKQLKFFVEVEFLQRGASVEVESWMLQPLGGLRPTALAGGLARS